LNVIKYVLIIYFVVAEFDRVYIPPNACKHVRNLHRHGGPTSLSINQISLITFLYIIESMN